LPGAASRVRVGLGSWFGALPPELRGRLSMIVTNPPYVAASEVADLPVEVREHEPHRALVSGPTGLEALEHVIDHAPEWLATPSVMVCEIAPHQAAAVVERARIAGFRDALVRADLTERPRVLVARRD
jgi:release factor glutamine methyltransferase